MSSVMNAGANGSAAVVVGVGGAVKSVPAGHSMQTILYSGDGIRDSYEAWGDAMMKFHGKRAQHSIMMCLSLTWATVQLPTTFVSVPLILIAAREQLMSA